VDIKTRQSELLESYITKSVITSNPLIIELLNEYWQSFEAREQIDRTALKIVRPLVKLLFEQNNTLYTSI
jgi:hypothetical protein